jgi:hypothetical protein
VIALNCAMIPVDPEYDLGIVVMNNFPGEKADEAALKRPGRSMASTGRALGSRPGNYPTDRIMGPERPRRIGAW